MGKATSRWLYAAAISFLTLNACGTPGAVPSAAVTASAPLSTPEPSTPTARAWTVLPSPTAIQSPTPAPTAGIPQFEDLTVQKQIDQLAGWFVGKGTNSGLGVSVVRRNPQTGQLEAMMLDYGTLGKGENLQVSPDTVYEIGSITKVFTGILLAEDLISGNVQLGDDIQQHLPTGVHAPSFDGTPITLRDLATHRSGLPRDVDAGSMPELYAWLSGFQLQRAPGSEYAYSNAGFALLADILDRRAGTDFNTLVVRSVSEPLGLIDTTETLNADQSDRLAQGYTYGGNPAQFFPDSGPMSGAGYMRSTLQDMTRFLIENMRPASTPLADAIQLAQTLQAEGPGSGTGVGLGWEIDQVGATSERLYKGGSTYGFTSYISFQRDGSFGFVLLTNGMFAENLVPHMLRILSAHP